MCRTAATAAAATGHFHHGCRCKVVPSTAGAVEGYDPDEWLDRWQAMRDIDADPRLSAAQKLEAKGRVAEADWKFDVGSLSVNNGYISSKSYASLFRKALGDGMPPEALDDARRILRHRSGTAFENLYAYDATDGKRLDSVVNSKTERRVIATDRMQSRIKDAMGKGHKVVMLHNHPGSSIPSAADFDSLMLTRSAFGLIIAHDGTIYRYSVVVNPVNGYALNDETLASLYQRRIARGKS